MDSVTIKTCQNCGAASLDEDLVCSECGDENFTIIDELICIPVENGDHFRFNRALSFLLQKYAGKECRIQIEEL